MIKKKVQGIATTLSLVEEGSNINRTTKLKNPSE